MGEPPCHRCRALCCRGFTTIPLRPDDYAEDAALVEAGYAERRHGLWMLPRDGGRCAYLDDTTNLCLIHAERPRACRDYDCRVPWAARNLVAMLAQQGIDDRPPTTDHRRGGCHTRPYHRRPTTDH